MTAEKKIAQKRLTLLQVAERDLTERDLMVVLRRVIC